MGGLPKYGVVSMSLPAGWRVEQVKSLYRGLRRCGDTCACVIVGGDTTRSDNGWCLSVSVIGEVKQGKVLSRNGAREGDLLCVTGEMGSARVGWEVLESGGERKRFANAIKRFLEPQLKLFEVQRLLESFQVTSMIDISDGLASEIGHICRQSQLGCVILEDKIPVAREVALWAEKKGESESKYVFESGEEYELLFTVDKLSYEKWRTNHPKGKDVKFNVIGEMVPWDHGMRIRRGGDTRPLPSVGWDHFCQ
jgi:thiamine-monophosphate kinase